MDAVRTVFSGARAGQKIVANIYRPRAQQQHANGAKRVTLLLAHANGFHKELWEPSLERLFARPSSQWTIVEAVALDAYNHGDSAVANRQSIVGETYAPWFLTARDILAVLSQLGSGGRRAVVGIGHSWGASSLLLAEIISPLSFAAIIATDPVLFDAPNGNKKIAAMTMKRRGEWADEAAAREYFDSHPFFGTWDPRIRRLYMAHGLEPPAPDAAARVLKCRPDNEAAIYRGALHASPFTANNLWRVRCPTAFLTGETSHLASPQHIAHITRDMVNCSRVVMPGAGHLLVQEHPDGAADHYAAILDGFAPRLSSATANI